MLTYITHLVDCSWFENKSILTYITHRVFMLQMLQSMLTYLAHNKICGYRFLIVIYLSPNIYTVICVPKLLQIYNLKSHFKHTCWHTWCRISKWACVPKLEQKSLYSQMAQSHALQCIGVWYDALDTFQVGQSSLVEACHVGLVFAIEIAIFGPCSPWIGTWSGWKRP